MIIMIWNKNRRTSMKSLRSSIKKVSLNSSYTSAPNSSEERYDGGYPERENVLDMDFSGADPEEAQKGHGVHIGHAVQEGHGFEGGLGIEIAPGGNRRPIVASGELPLLPHHPQNKKGPKHYRLVGREVPVCSEPVVICVIK
jgi:hypothetical protein